jgi:hypothetical protein
MGAGQFKDRYIKTQLVLFIGFGVIIFSIHQFLIILTNKILEPIRWSSGVLILPTRSGLLDHK